MKRMKFGLPAAITLCVIIWLAVGCEYVPAFAAGAATSETLQDWQDNLETKQSELQARYEAAERAIADAPDPNALALAIDVREALREPILINEAALITLRSAMAAKKEEGGSQGRADAVLTGVAGLIAIAYREWTRRRLNKSHKSMKTGQARLKIEEPAAEAKLYAFTGEERMKLGL